MITSASNQKIKILINIIQKSKARREQDVFITEGMKMFQEAPMDKIVEVYVAESFYETGTAREKIQQCGYEILSDELFKKVSDTQTPQGILCVMKQYHYELEDLFQKENPLFLILEDIQDPGNLGTMIRTAEGAGACAVIMSKGTVDIYNPKTIRSTMGSLYRVPFLYVEKLTDAVQKLQAKDIKVYAAHLSGEKYFDEIEYDRGSGFLIGNEGNGLRKETADSADIYLKIPMEGKLESLNAGVAAALLMYRAAGYNRKNGH